MKNQKFVVYYRVSTDKQKQSGLGIEAQKSMVKNYLKNIAPIASLTEVESGAHPQRVVLSKALRLCAKEKATLVVAKLDRLSRDLHFLTSIEKSKIPFVCCDMPFANKLTIHLMAILAEWERDQIKERTKRALTELKKKAHPLAPFIQKWRKVCLSGELKSEHCEEGKRNLHLL